MVKKTMTTLAKAADDSPTMYAEKDGLDDMECEYCGIALSESPQADDAHPVRMGYYSDDGALLCEACMFPESYSQSGAEMLSDEFVTVYVAHKPVGDVVGLTESRYFETHQAASGWARSNGGEYLGRREMDAERLETVE